jgi:hypothetical protein
MRRALALAAFAACFVSGAPARGDTPPDPGAPQYVDWVPTVAGAFDAAKKEGKPLFLAINAVYVLGRTRVEPAAKELRERTYLDPAVVAKSRSFVCTLVKPDGTSDDYAELRSRLGIQGDIVSPQHVFVHADGILISRKEYWPHSAGAESVQALLALMDAALSAHRAKTNIGAGGAGGTASEQRAAWIQERLAKVRPGEAARAAREAAIPELVQGDKAGDAIGPLCALLLDEKRDAEVTVAIVRALGKPGLEKAVAGVAHVLDDTSEAVRGNAAVTLEYVGSATAVDALAKRLPKEHDPAVRNNLCRALGWCGRKQEAVRKTLLREFSAAKDNRASYGPAIGLSYFEGDAEVARGIEKAISGGVEWQRRAFGLFALTHVGDAKSAEFVQEKVLKGEKNQAAIPFLKAVVTVLQSADADGSALRAVKKGVESALGTIADVGGPARAGRDQSEFTPNGELVPSRGRGR